MSDLPTAIARLELAVQQLTLSVDLLSLRVSQIESQVQASDSWELVEPSEIVEGGLPPRSIVLEEGPPPLSPALEVYASILSEIGGGRRARAKAAFEAGFWAQIAAETNTEYTPVVNRDLSTSHWIVLRGAGVSSPFRVTRRLDLNRLLSRSPGQVPSGGVSTQPIVQAFASLCELRIFCGGAGISVPPLLRWRSQ